MGFEARSVEGGEVFLLSHFLQGGLTTLLAGAEPQAKRPVDPVLACADYELMPLLYAIPSSIQRQAESTNSVVPLIRAGNPFLKYLKKTSLAGRKSSMLLK